MPTVDIKTYGLYSLYSTLMEREISTLKGTFGDETAGALLSFSMMRLGYQTPIKRAGNYHSHDFISEDLFTNALGDKCITKTLRTVGENRERMRQLLDDLPEEGRNFVIMDSTHAQSLSDNLNVDAVGYNPDFTFEK